MRFLFILFIIVPILEMLLLFEVSDHIGGLSTVGLVLLTAVVGVQILKQQGFSTLTRANQRMQSGQIPAQEMMEGIFLAVGGAFLLTPGFITDTLGFLCLIPVTRRWLVKALIKSGRFKVHVAGTSRHPGARPGRHQGGRDVYEGEFTREQPSDRHIDRDEL